MGSLEPLIRPSIVVISAKHTSPWSRLSEEQKAQYIWPKSLVHTFENIPLFTLLHQKERLHIFWDEVAFPVQWQEPYSRAPYDSTPNIHARKFSGWEHKRWWVTQGDKWCLNVENKLPTHTITLFHICFIKIVLFCVKRKWRWSRIF